MTMGKNKTEIENLKTREDEDQSHITKQSQHSVQYVSMFIAEHSDKTF